MYAQTDEVFGLDVSHAIANPEHTSPQDRVGLKLPPSQVRYIFQTNFSGTGAEMSEWFWETTAILHHHDRAAGKGPL